MRMTFDPDRTYEVPGETLMLLEQLAQRLDLDCAMEKTERQQLAQELRARLNDAELVDDDSEVYVEEDETDPSTEPCQVCGSQEMTLLGVLATVTHYRCRHCGWTQSVGVEEVAS